jgi:hypothetical protein
MAGMKGMAGMSSAEIYTAIAVGIGLWLLLDHFDLISSGYSTGRLESMVTVAFGAGIVMLVWPLIFNQKKKDDSDDPT